MEGEVMSRVVSILYTHRSVNLLCDGEKLQLRYKATDEHPYGVWFCNDEDTGKQCTSLIQWLKSKYSSIKVTWCRAW
jgi:hypothetical protein